MLSVRSVVRTPELLNSIINNTIFPVMMKKILTSALLVVCMFSSAEAQEPYFLQTFDEKFKIDGVEMSSQTEYPCSLQVEGQGEWIFNKSYVAYGEEMKTNYVKDGSKGDLRIVKSGGYVVTPLLAEGVGRITLDENRTKKYLSIYTSDDGGLTWTQVATYSKNTTQGMTVTVRSRTANRVKIENPNGSNDCDIDNLAVYPMTGDEPGSDITSDNGIVDIIHCSPEGNDETADGSEAKPFYSLQKAVDLAGPGDTIYMAAGRYQYDARININHGGTQEKPIALFARNGRAVLDFSSMPYHKHSDNPQQGIRLCGSYWHLYRIDICNASDNGLLIERNKPTGGSSADIMNATEQAHDNIIEQCNFYKNGDTGLQMKNLASFNYVINCDSYLNCDEEQGDADGFAPKISVGDGNYFYGCRAWLNSDDGWDVFFKKDGGFPDNVSIIMESCIAYKNGFLDENTVAPSGNGNGFKMGSDQGAMNVYLNRCLAVCNKAKGFDQNHNAGDIIMNNCTGMTLKSISDKSYSYRIYEQISEGHEVRLTNCIAINDNDATDKRDKNGNVKPSEHGKQGQYGRFEVDETLSGLTLVTSEFQKAAPSEFLDDANHRSLIAERLSDGSIPDDTYARLQEGSFLIDAGTAVPDGTYRGIPVRGITYSGLAPDLGAYESHYGSAASLQAVSTSDRPSGLRLRQTAGGLTLLTVDAPAVSRCCQLLITDTQGRILERRQFAGNTTLHLPLHAGPLVLKVQTDGGFTSTLKIFLK